VSDPARPIPLSLLTDSLAQAIERVQLSGGVEQVLVTRIDGLPIAHNLTDANQAKPIAAMAAAIVGTGEMATKDLGRGALHGATIDAEWGRLVCLRAGPEAIVAGLGETGGNVGLMLLVLRELATVVDRAITEWQDPTVPPRRRADPRSGSPFA
jgi:predicted regulator of Ras-like GTPase activity (Roadblock/LC7/MglB family)